MLRPSSVRYAVRVVSSCHVLISIRWVLVIVRCATRTEPAQIVKSYCNNNQRSNGNDYGHNGHGLERSLVLLELAEAGARMLLKRRVLVIYFRVEALKLGPLGLVLIIPITRYVVLLAIMAHAFILIGAQVTNFLAPFADILRAAPAKRTARVAHAIIVFLAGSRTLIELGAHLVAAPAEALIMVLAVVADDFTAVEACAAGNAPARGTAP